MMSFLLAICYIIICDHTCKYGILVILYLFLKFYQPQLFAMKKIPFFISACIFLSACNSATNKSTEASVGSASAAEEKVDYVYSIDKPDNWEKGSLKNVDIAMKSLKAFETGNIAASMQYFADTVRFAVDKMDQKFAKDSLQSMLIRHRAALQSVRIQMQDWESVVSKDKADEYVSLWYKQFMTDQAGKTDSVVCMDDIKMKDGKIVSIDEKTRVLPGK